MLKTVTLAALLALPIAAMSTGDDEKAAVERATLDYLEAFYDVKPEYIERSVHESLTKYGFWRAPDATDYKGGGMTFDEAVALAKRWNTNGDRTTDESPRKVEILDILDQTAAVKLTAQWGVDYMHLAKYEGKWKIVHVMWQSHPPTER